MCYFCGFIAVNKQHQSPPLNDGSFLRIGVTGVCLQLFMGNNMFTFLLCWEQSASCYFVSQSWIFFLMAGWKIRLNEVLERCYLLCVEQHSRAKCCFESNQRRVRDGQHSSLFGWQTCSYSSEHSYTPLTMRHLKANANATWIRECVMHASKQNKR